MANSQHLNFWSDQSESDWLGFGRACECRLATRAKCSLPEFLDLSHLLVLDHLSGNRKKVRTSFVFFAIHSFSDVRARTVVGNQQVPSNRWFGLVLWGFGPLVQEGKPRKPPIGTPPSCQSKAPTGRKLILGCDSKGKTARKIHIFFWGGP